MKTALRIAASACLVAGVASSVNGLRWGLGTGLCQTACHDNTGTMEAWLIPGVVLMCVAVGLFAVAAVRRGRLADRPTDAKR
jgi:hypothetical protein